MTSPLFVAAMLGGLAHARRCTYCGHRSLVVRATDAHPRCPRCRRLAPGAPDDAPYRPTPRRG